MRGRPSPQCSMLTIVVLWGGFLLAGHFAGLMVHLVICPTANSRGPCTPSPIY